MWLGQSRRWGEKWGMRSGAGGHAGPGGPPTSQGLSRGMTGHHVLYFQCSSGCRVSASAREQTDEMVIFLCARGSGERRCAGPMALGAVHPASSLLVQCHLPLPAFPPSSSLLSSAPFQRSPPG